MLEALPRVVSGHTHIIETRETKQTRSVIIVPREDTRTKEALIIALNVQWDIINLMKEAQFVISVFVVPVHSQQEQLIIQVVFAMKIITGMEAHVSHVPMVLLGIIARLAVQKVPYILLLKKDIIGIRMRNLASDVFLLSRVHILIT